MPTMATRRSARWGAKCFLIPDGGPLNHLVIPNWAEGPVRNLLSALDATEAEPKIAGTS
jgi:hypothetical protein